MPYIKDMFLLSMGIMTVILYFVWLSQGSGLGKNYTDKENFIICHVSLMNTRSNQVEGMTVIYFITPTYPRREQVAELTRLGQTLMHVSNIHWIVADDNPSCSDATYQILKKIGIPFTYLSSPMPKVYRKASVVPRGVANRRAALRWLRENANSGVLYFGDDDNTFDLQLFDEIRDTQKVSMFPVGLIGDYSVSSPVVKDGKVIGFFDSWPSKRIFPVDMAGFAVNVEFFLKHPKAEMPYIAGYEEDFFLRSLEITLNNIEPKASNCTKVLVWHTQTAKKPLPTINIKQPLDNSLNGLLDELKYSGLAQTSVSSGVKMFITREGETRSL